MSDMNPTEQSPKYWLSLEQWRDDEQFQKLAEQEFMSSPLQNEDGKDGWARREFLKLMGASIALTSFGCVRRPAQKIVPYAKAPEDVIPGIANYYTSSYSDALENFGLIVKTREGRPTKVEGNPDHPMNRGALSARGNAHILSLWDPDRLTAPKKNLQNETKSNHDTVNYAWEKADEEIAAQLKQGKVALLTGVISSPSTRALINDFKQAFGATQYTWDATGLESVSAGQAKSFGSGAMAKPRFANADLVVTIDTDFLGTYLAPTEFTRDFSARRKPGSDMLKLVSFESILSLTGMNADERYRMKPSEQLAVVMGILYQIVVKGKSSRYAGDSTLTNALSKFATASNPELQAAIEKVAQELWSKRGQSLVLAGGMVTQTSQGLELQAAVNLLNVALENDGKTVDYQSIPNREASAGSLQSLAKAINEGQIQTVIIYKTNPVYSASPDIKIADALRKAKMVVYVDDRNDETGRISDYVLSLSHPMESWGDVEAAAGVYSIQQPTVRPLYDTRSFEDGLIQWMKKADKGAAKSFDTWYDYLRANWKNKIYSGADFENFWSNLLQTGVYNKSGYKKDSTAGGRNASSAALASVSPVKTDGYELVLYMTSGLADGTLANVSWLQEFPDPVTKICWDNYVCMSVADAKREKVHEGDIVKLQMGDRKIEAPAHIQPGQADSVLAIAVGYGRNGLGKVADHVGVNAYSLAQVANGLTVYSGLPVKMSKTGKKGELANVQGHNSMEGRQIVVEATLAQYTQNKSANIHRHHMMTMWDEHKYPKHKWGMVVDLNTCTGCSACVIACQSENNVPTVGKKYVLKGREMHWLRIDRYFAGEPENPSSVFQPLPCQHCDNAPCETVCPVIATVHSDEGTNDMIYNRCVGTRYCSNNCPYKVRRFNWFNYLPTFQTPLNEALNPEVTVRSRGVMEKCTFCIHRIKDVQRAAKLEDRPLKDGDVKTACQQSCPANAIVFGDLKDPESKVSKLFNIENSYTLLEELNAKPAVKYLSKIRNTDALKGSGGHGHEGHHS